MHHETNLSAKQTVAAALPGERCQHDTRHQEIPRWFSTVELALHLTLSACISRCARESQYAVAMSQACPTAD